MIIRFLLGIVLLFPIAAAAQPAAPDLLAVDSAFVKGEYERVELLTLRILQGDAELTANEAARLNLTAGYALIMLGRETDARAFFAQALDAAPDLTLDPVQVSPKFRVVFDEVKAEHARRRAAHRAAADSAGVSAALWTGRARPQSLLLNLALPGAGAWREGHRLRGAATLAVQAAAAGVLVWRVGEMRDSRADYLVQTDPARIGAAYDDYNRDYRTVWAAGILTGAIYLAAQADLIFLKPRVAHKPQAALTPLPSGGVQFAVRW